MTTGGQTQFSNLKFFPLTYVVKYDPPMIGMVYKTSEKDTKKRIYKIYLHGLIYKNDADQITRQLFQEHALHINENVVSQKQVLKISFLYQLEFLWISLQRHFSYFFIQTNFHILLT